MEASPFFTPGFIVPTALGLIGFVAWLIRLESKVNTGEKGMIKIEQAVEDSWEVLEKHRSNENVHFNQRLAQEVERRQTDRMDRMQVDITEIKTMVKELKATTR